MLRVVAIDKFPPPSSLTKKNLGSQTSIYVEWSSVSPGPAPSGEVLGYRLRVEDANNGESWIAFDGQEYSQPLKLSHTVYGLTSGRDYRFSVAAISINGVGEWYDPPETFFACIAPSQFEAPLRVASTVDSITINWKVPEQNGGCDILGYAVFVDDGANGAFTEVNSANDPQVRNLPGL